MNRNGNTRGNYQDAVHDYLLPLMKYYETWGRDIKVKILTSSGNDETAQRADVVAAKADTPFAVVNFVPAGLDVFDAEMAKAKILVFGYATTAKKAVAQAPYRWGLTDSQAVAVNSSEVIGKQLVGKKAQFGGDDVKQQTRTFGAVYMDGTIDIAQFKTSLQKYHATLAADASYLANGSPRGDATTAQEQAPVIATKLKQAGVTTVVLFTDVAMTTALMENATKQEWSPEWFFTGTVFQDLALLARAYPVEQSSHALRDLQRVAVGAPRPHARTPTQKSLTVLTNPLNWYWGETAGTSASATGGHLTWLLTGIQAAGPKLTPKTFQQGLFSIPASGGAAQDYPTGGMTAYGKTAGLPYDEYLSLGLDFSPVWWDNQTSGPSQGTGSEGTGVAWYTDGAKRYRGGTVPKQQFGWFQKATSVYKFDTRPTPAPVYVGDCAGCPSQGGPGQPGTSPAGFIAKAHGGGEAALS